MIRDASVPLVRCSDCDSTLLQPLSVVGPLDGASIVARYCPECGLYDSVVAEDIAVRVWLRREHRLAMYMIEAADGLAAEIAGLESAGRG